MKSAKTIGTEGQETCTHVFGNIWKGPVMAKIPKRYAPNGTSGIYLNVEEVYRTCKKCKKVEIISVKRFNLNRALCEHEYGKAMTETNLIKIHNTMDLTDKVYKEANQYNVCKKCGCKEYVL